jgi:sugar phosphate isomerase/epimerase
MKASIITSILIGLALAAVNVPAQEHTAGIGKSFKGPIGLQLYSLRDQFKKDVPGTLDEVKNFGFKYVELAGTYNMKPAEFKAELDKRGLVAISGHFPYDRYQNDLDGIAKEAKALGLKYVGCAWIPHEGKFDEKKCREVIQVFNHAGEELAKQGFKFFYHTHGYEFQPFGDGTLFDLLVQQTHPKYVRFEMDIFWIVNPGQDPVQLFKKYHGRFELTHLKDMKKGTPTGPNAPVAGVNADVALGAGQMDMPAILKAAQQSGVKWNFIEDESNVSEKQIPQSLKYLEQVKF